LTSVCNFVAGVPVCPGCAPDIADLTEPLMMALFGGGSSPFWIAAAFFVADTGVWTCAPVLTGVIAPCHGPPLTFG
jgi:hypothetical protein